MTERELKEHEYRTIDVWHNTAFDLNLNNFLQSWGFLLLLGISLAFTAMILDFFLRQLNELQSHLTLLSDVPVLQGLMWVLYSVVFCVLSVSMIVYVSPMASGPGIPEMRCILSGIELYEYLSVRTLCAKVFGFVAAYVSGFSIGKEGPYLHIASIICSLLAKIPIFRNIRRNDAVYLEVLSAACAAGVTCAFGATVGGVLFSIEVTASFYLVGNMWRGFFVSATAATLVKIAHENDLVTLFLPEPSLNSLYDFEIMEMLVFAIMGLGGGILGSLFVKTLHLSKYLVNLSKFLNTTKGVYITSIVICVITSSLAFPFPILRNDVQDVMKILVSPSTFDWTFLIGILSLKFVLSILATCSNIPYGIYSPCFLTGAIYGRICGEVFILIFPTLEAKIEMGTYVIIGAAAFSTGVTRTVSTAVMVIELTKQVNLLLPVLLAVLISNSIGSLISYSVYDVLVEEKNLPLMPQFSIYNSFSDQAMDVMTEVNSLHEQPTYRDCIKILSDSGSRTFPFVDQNGVFLGSVSRRNVIEVLAEHGIHDWGIQSLFDDHLIELSLTQNSTETDSNESTHLDELVPVIFPDSHNTYVQGFLYVNETAMQVDKFTSLFKVHFLFTMLGLGDLFVVSRGRLVGVITRYGIIRSLKKYR